MRRVVRAAAVVLVVSLAGLAAWRLVRTSPWPGVGETVAVELRSCSFASTKLAFFHPGPAPWPNGNGMSINRGSGYPSGEGLSVVNMHSENFHRAVEDFGLETVEVLRIDGRRCLVTDPRVPRSWLTVAPDAQLLAAYPQHFRTP